MAKMAILKIGYRGVLLPLSDAVKVAELLADAQFLESDYAANVGYKLTNGREKLEVQVLSTADLGEIELSRDCD